MPLKLRKNPNKILRLGKNWGKYEPFWIGKQPVFSCKLGKIKSLHPNVVVYQRLYLSKRVDKMVFDQMSWKCCRRSFLSTVASDVAQFLDQLAAILRSTSYFNKRSTVMILSFRTDMHGQTVQTQIRQLLEEQSDQGLHCLPFRLHRLDSLLYGRAT